MYQPTNEKFCLGTAGTQHSAAHTAGTEPSAEYTAGTQPSAAHTASTQPSAAHTAGTQPSVPKLQMYSLEHYFILKFNFIIFSTQLINGV